MVRGVEGPLRWSEMGKGGIWTGIGLNGEPWVAWKIGLEPVRPATSSSDSAPTVGSVGPTLNPGRRRRPRRGRT